MKTEIDTEGKQKLHNKRWGYALLMYSMTYLFRSFKLPSCRAGATGYVKPRFFEKSGCYSRFFYSFGMRGKCHAKKIL